MAEAVPPGRAGRQWLVARIAFAERSLELLDKKQVLLREELRELSDRQSVAAQIWSDASTAAEAAGLRAAALSGAAGVALVASTVAGRAEVEVPWRNTIGVVHPGEPCVTPAELAAPDAAAGGGSILAAAAAYRRALEAAAASAAADRSLAVLSAELRATQRRCRALERRRLPSLRDQLGRLEVRLDELEREQQVVTRWAAGRSGR